MRPYFLGTFLLIGCATGPSSRGNLPIPDSGPESTFIVLEKGAITCFEAESIITFLELIDAREIDAAFSMVKAMEDASPEGPLPTCFMLKPDYPQKRWRTGNPRIIYSHSVGSEVWWYVYADQVREVGGGE